MDYKVFNKTDSQDLIVEKGDTIHAKEKLNEIREFGRKL